MQPYEWFCVAMAESAFPCALHASIDRAGEETQMLISSFLYYPPESECPVGVQKQFMDVRTVSSLFFDARKQLINEALIAETLPRSWHMCVVMGMLVGFKHQMNQNELPPSDKICSEATCLNRK